MYPALGQLRVVDAMHPGLISCSPDMPLRTVARMMATYRVHAILVTAHGEEALPGGSVWGVISDADLLRAVRAGDLDEQAARTIAATPGPDRDGRRGAGARRAAHGRARGLAPDRGRAAVGPSGRHAFDTRHRASTRRIPRAASGAASRTAGVCARQSPERGLQALASWPSAFLEYRVPDAFGDFAQVFARAGEATVQLPVSRPPRAGPRP